MSKVAKIPLEGWISAGLALLSMGVYSRVQGFPFLAYDDQTYLVLNPHVRSGLSFKGALWALTAFRASNWHPLTWLSHMADVSMFGMDPGMHHLVNLGLHILNAILLFLLFRAMTGSIWRSAFLGALFAVHPLHVESVAWVAERKDVLSMAFALLALLAYQRYARTGSRRSLMGAGALYALGLMAKPMLVSLPLLMLFLDYWPLGRLCCLGRDLGARLREKVPFLLLALGSCVVTFLAQHAGGAVATLENLDARIRLLNVLTAYVRYLGHTVWPWRLAVLYPFQSLEHLRAYGALSAVLLGAISWAAYRERKRKPYLLAGWLWFLVSLLPVIGIVQVGFQSMADRYTYLPLIGPFASAAWFGADWALELRCPRPLAAVFAALTLGVLLILGRIQTEYWRDTRTLFQHCLRVTGPRNPEAHLNLGYELLREGCLSEALEEFKQAQHPGPRGRVALSLTGETLFQMGRFEEALGPSREAIRQDPTDFYATYRMAQMLSALGRHPEAAGYYRSFLDLEPLRTEKSLDAKKERELSQSARMALGLTLRKIGQAREAARVFQEAHALDPRNPAILVNLALSLAEAGSHAEALQALEEALPLAPGQAIVHRSLGQELAYAGRSDESRAEFAQAARLDAAGGKVGR